MAKHKRNGPILPGVLPHQRGRGGTKVPEALNTMMRRCAAAAGRQLWDVAAEHFRDGPVEEMTTCEGVRNPVRVHAKVIMYYYDWIANRFTIVLRGSKAAELIEAAEDFYTNRDRALAKVVRELDPYNAIQPNPFRNSY